MHLHKTIPEKFDKDLWQKNLTPFLILWKKLNHGLDFIKLTIPDLADEKSPVRSFIFEEFRLGVTMIQKIHKNFMMINKIIKGNCPPEDDEFNIVNNLLTLQVSYKCCIDKYEGIKNFILDSNVVVESVERA